jgi:hypothetical protein
MSRLSIETTESGIFINCILGEGDSHETDMPKYLIYVTAYFVN